MKLSYSKRNLQLDIASFIVVQLCNDITAIILMKVKLNVGDRDERDRMIAALCEHSHAVLVQRVGNIALLFLRKRKDSKFPVL